MQERIADIMSRAAAAVTPIMSVAQARALANQRGVHHLLVVDDGALLGIVCRCDLDWAVDDEPVSRRMRPSIGSSKPEDTLAQAAAIMLQRGIGCLPVLDEQNTLLGVITRSDLRRSGALPGERGVDCCAACGTSHCLLSAGCPDTPVFCFDCLDQVRGNGARELYFTLGGGD